MPWSGSPGSQSFSRTDGTRTGTQVWQNADAAGVDIVPDDHDTHDQDLATGLNLALKKDGGNTATADIPMGGNKLTNVGDADARNQYAPISQIARNAGLYAPTVGGTANAITLTTGFSLSAYAAGQTFRFLVGSNNTGSVTVDVDGLGVKTLKRSDGTSDVIEGDLIAGGAAVILYDGTNFQLAGNVNGSASADILARVTPVGIGNWWSLPTIPAGWAIANGQALTKSSYPELDAKYHADGYPYGASSATLGVGTLNLPNVAGRHVRAVDGGAGVDPDAASRTDRGDGTTGDNVGTLQADEFKLHRHSTSQVSDNTTDVPDTPNEINVTFTVTNVTVETGDTGGNETRPKNIYQYFIVLINPAVASAASVGLFGLPYSFDAATTDADPGSGNLRLNNATLSSVTAMYISDQEGNSVDVSAFILTWDDSTSTANRGTLKISKVGAPSNFALYTISGASTDNTGYVSLALTHVASNGSFSSGDNISIEFFRTGDLGTAGTIGFSFDFSSTTAMADPGAGSLRLNNATLSSVTAVAIDDLTSETGNPDLSAYIATWDDSTSAIKGKLIIQKSVALENFAVYNITGLTDNSGWTQLTVSHVDSAGSFANTDEIRVSFIPTGDKGDSGTDPGLKFAFDTSTSMAEPGNGDVRFNNATLSSVTAMAFDADSADTGNPDVSDFIASWDDITNATATGVLYIKKISAPENFATYRVTAVTDNATWLQVTVSHVASAGSFSATDELSIQFSPSGQDGGGSGDVTAASAFGTDNLLIRSDGTGKGVQASGIAIDDTDNVTGVETLGLNDSDGSHSLLIAAGSNLTANRTLTVNTGDANRALTLSGDATLTGDPIEQGKHTIVVPALAMSPATTSGPASAQVETATNAINYPVLDFDASADEYAHFSIPMPPSWNEGTITFKFWWTTTGAVTTGVALALQAVARSDNEAIDAAYGTAVVVTDDAQGATEEQLESAESAAVTIAGTPAAGDIVYFRIFRDVSDANDDMTQDMRLISLQIFYTINAATDA